MQIEPAIIIAVGGCVATLVVNAFTVGVAYGKLSSRISKNSEDIEDIRTTGMVGIRSEMAKIDGKFFTPEGEQRLMSFKAHDHICTRANEAITAELRHVTAALNTNTTRVKECGDQVAQLSIGFAVLEEKVDGEKEKK
ncbi:MAG: hypothetical protein VR65_06290 [Desulfobulbaceae bacterium BRH_c16a]|nr:MAG: hypothetical protein VR65_25080 [Desulfobulbaceae bacterium BRH_c16a]KJS02246.1 MAG: hypothetical protein VR65_06290 [Desulfobulbaceae bacterium BRH_c16a]